MTFIGVNIGRTGRYVEWQVENSWGFWDYETPGLDGFWCMKDDWFDDHVFEVVVHKTCITKHVQRVFESAETIKVNPWTSAAKCLMTRPMQKKIDYKKVDKKIIEMYYGK